GRLPYRTRNARNASRCDPRVRSPDCRAAPWKSWSASRLTVGLGCLKIGVHTPAVQKSVRIEGGLDAACQSFDFRLQRFEDVDAGPDLGLGTDQGRMSAANGDRPADIGGAGVRRGR